MQSWLKRLFLRPKELSVAQSYALWAPDYPPHAHNPLMELEESALLDMLPAVLGASALDLACGSGRYLKRLLLRGASPVVGLDSSPPMLAHARAITPNLVNADLLSTGLRSSAFRVVTCGLALGHVQDLRRAMIEISRVMAPEGALVYSDFHPFGSLLGWKRTFRGSDGREYVVRHFTHLYSDHVAACAAAGLHIEEVREPQINFEHRWRGYPALLVIRARKTG
jgi:malonyl-CoA O-methyltransferase